MGKAKWAVIEIGSNTIRLVIYEKNTSGYYKEAENIKNTARLRRYLTDDQILLPKGRKVLVQVLKGFQEIIKFHHVQDVHCVATATIRQSKNQQEIIAYVKKETSFDIRILTEKEEAYYGFYAVSHSTPIETGITIDIGGGSTEITYFEKRKLKHYHSFPFGVLSLKELFVQNDQQSEKERTDMAAFIIQSLEQLPWLKNRQVPIIAIGGSASNIAQIDQNLKKNPIAGIHQYMMSPLDLFQIQGDLEKLTLKELEKVEGLSKDRADIIVPALEVFVQLCQYCQTNTFMFSKKGLRDGISLKKSDFEEENITTDQMIDNSINELIDSYHIERSQAQHVGALAQQLFDETDKFGLYTEKNSLDKFNKWVDQVYYLGQY
jgi:exopolyphosphatase/guanosine-5'-triphosphate,3'-diphosphate pyrophosphatase